MLCSARRTDPVEAAVCRPSLAHRLGCWQIVQVDRLAVVVEGPVVEDPFGRGSCAPHPRTSGRAGRPRLVVEDHRAGRRAGRRASRCSSQLRARISSRGFWARAAVAPILPSQRPQSARRRVRGGAGLPRMPRRVWVVAMAVVWALTAAGAAQAQSPGQVPPPSPSPNADAPAFVGSAATPTRPPVRRSQAPVHGAERALEPPRRRLPDRHQPVGRTARQDGRTSALFLRECASITVDSQGRLVTICVGLEAPVLAMLDPHTLQALAAMDLPPPQPRPIRSRTSPAAATSTSTIATGQWSRPPTATSSSSGETGAAPGFELRRDYDVARRSPRATR